MRLRYKLPFGRRLRLAVKGGAVHEREDYRGWIDEDGHAVHQFGIGRARLRVPDREISHVIDLGPGRAEAPLPTRWGQKGGD